MGRIKKHKQVHYQCKLKGSSKIQTIVAHSIKDPREIKLLRAYDEVLAGEASGNNQRPLTEENILPYLNDFGLSKEYAKGDIKRLSG